MVNPETQQVLNALVQNHGRNAVNDANAFEALLRDGAGSNARDANLLIAALKAGVPQEMLTGTTDGTSLAKRLQDESFVAPEAAQAAVQAWATALGVNASFAGAAATPFVSPAAPSAPTPVSPAAPPAAATPAAAPMPVGAYPASAGAPAPQPAPQQPYAAPQQQGYGQQPNQGQQPYQQYGQGQPPRAKSNTGLIVGIIVAVVLLGGGGGLGFWLWKKNQTPAATTAVTPPVVSTTGGMTGGIGGTTTTGGDDGGTTGMATTGGDISSGDLSAYNDRMKTLRQAFESQSNTFQSAATAASTETDQNAKFDKIAQAYSSMSTSLESLANDVEAVSAPSEAQAIHTRFVSFIREMSSLLRAGATAATNRDQSAIQSNATELQTFVTRSDGELASLVTSAGFDATQYRSDGTLVKK